MPSASPETPGDTGANRRTPLPGTLRRRLVAGFAVVLALAGVGVLLRPLATNLWAHYRQGRIDRQFDDAQFRHNYRAGVIDVGDGLTRLRIPRLGVTVMVAEGTSGKALRTGAGHYTGTPLPGQPGNVAIAGHRTTYGHPFQHLERMKPGDIVSLKTPFAVYTYTVVPPFGGHGNPWAAAPTDYDVVASQPVGRWLTLTTCHPPGSARQRLVLRLRLTDSEHLTSKGEA